MNLKSKYLSVSVPILCEEQKLKIYSKMSLVSSHFLPVFWGKNETFSLVRVRLITCRISGHLCWCVHLRHWTGHRGQQRGAGMEVEDICLTAERIHHICFLDNLRWGPATITTGRHKFASATVLYCRCKLRTSNTVKYADQCCQC